VSEDIECERNQNVVVELEFFIPYAGQSSKFQRDVGLGKKE